jgi:hypothetical protein
MSHQRADDYLHVVEAAWNSNGHEPNALHASWANMGHMAGSLRDRSRTSFGYVRREIGRLEHVLRRLRSVIVTDDLPKRNK